MRGERVASVPYGFSTSGTVSSLVFSLIERPHPRREPAGQINTSSVRNECKLAQGAGQGRRRGAVRCGVCVIVRRPLISAAAGWEPAPRVPTN